MKTRICIIRTQGQVLLVCLGIAAVLGISLAAIFSYTSNQFVAVARSQSWNESLVIAEAGVEDAMQLINKYANTSTPGSSWIITVAADNWETLAANVYHVRRFINSNYYDVYITNDNPAQPIIRSTGVKLWQTSFDGDNEVSRTVVVATGSESLFQAGLLAKRGIDLNGNVLIDSYNSKNPAYSANGQYDATKRKDGGNVATVISNMTQAVIVGGSVDIYGKIYTGPGDTIKLTGSGTAGSLSWVNGSSTGIEPGWSQNDLNVAIPDAEAPSMASPLLLPPKIANIYQGTNFNSSYRLLAGDYKKDGNLSMSGDDTVLVTGPGTTKLFVTGDISMSGQTRFIIASNASLVLYLGKQLDMKGQGLVNQSGFATNFVIYGQPSNTQIELGGNSTFTGVIYAPYADLRFIGGGSSPDNFCGSAVGNTITVSGKYQIHYDESLIKQASGASYYVTSWKEQ